MTIKAKIKTLAEETDDAEVTAMLQAQAFSNGDPAQWVKDKYGDLDWAYTARVVRKWSQDALLTHIWEKAFSIPPREYNPSAPFVYVKMHDGEVITLPHGYRLPLMFVAKYYWGITLNRLQDAELWKKERANIFHLSRLCENIFQRARAKAFAGGMEKGWRCLMFDRLLARFYKGWYRNDPPSGKEFVTKFGVKEYDRDVLKHDWKRWCTRGLNGVKMRESEVGDGITIEKFRQGLQKGEDGVWKLNGQPLSFITVDEDPAWSSTSELTDCDMYDEEGSDADAEGDIVPVEAGGITVVTAPPPPEPIRSPEKRILDLPIDEDELERATKRARIENISDDCHYPLHATYPLTRTLAAMAKNPVWATTSSAFASGSNLPLVEPFLQNTPASPSRLPQGSMTSPSQLFNEDISGTPRWSGQPFPMSSTATAMGFAGESSTPIKRDEPLASPKSVVVITRPKSKPSVPRRSSFSVSSRVASSSQPSKAKARPSGKYSSASSLLRPTGSKPRQTRASQIAGVATVNVYVSDGKPRGGAAAHSASKAQSRGNPKSKARSPGPKSFRQPSPSVHAASIEPPPNNSSTLPLPDSATASLANPVDTTPTSQSLPPVEPIFPPEVTAMATSVTPSNSETLPTLSRDVITAKALELLVNLVDAKQLLSSELRASSSSSETQPTTTSSVILSATADHMGLAGRFQNLEERFVSVKEELRDIVGRLQNLENEARAQREMKKEDDERVIADKVVECSPVSMTLGIQTDRSDAEDVEMGGIARSDRGWDDQVDDTVIQPPQRVLGEIAVQTEEEDLRQFQQPDSQPEENLKSDQTPTNTAVEILATDRNCGSETDTDSTVNAVKDEPIDPRAQEMSSNLSLFVNDLVSVKMLSVMGDMLKGKAKDPAMVDLEASLRSMSPAIHQSSDSFALSNLLDEVKTFKEESRAREMREKEEMQAMRQLHSAEVDALRRRLSYLESQNNPMDSRSIRSSSTHSTQADGACHISGSGLTDSGRHSRQHRRPYPSGSTPLSPSGSGGGEGDQASPLNSVGSTHALSTPVHSDRSFSFARPGPDRDDELPLPIKSQRKQHMSFPRATFG